MRTLISAAALLLALSACGGGDETDDADPSPDTTSTTNAALTTLTEVCPQIESELPEVDATADEWSAFIDTIGDLSSAADLEAQNALELLLPGAESARTIAAEGGLPAEAEMNVSDSVQAFADRCEAAGSSALQ